MSSERGSKIRRTLEADWAHVDSMRGKLKGVRKVEEEKSLNRRIADLKHSYQEAKSSFDAFKSKYDSSKSGLDSNNRRNWNELEKLVSDIKKELNKLGVNVD